jgi:hypothetical protein
MDAVFKGKEVIIGEAEKGKVCNEVESRLDNVVNNMRVKEALR